MKFLADENFPRPVVEKLRSEGHDVLWARTDCRGFKDRALLERAEAEGRIVLTLDKDFVLITRQRSIPLQRGGVILFRVHPAIPEHLEPLVESALREGRGWTGCVSVVTKDGVEMGSAE